MSLIDRIEVSPAGGGFKMDDYWVWCGSVIQGEDQHYHMYASRWSKRFEFYLGYLFFSEVVHAVSPTPEGPYEFRDVALPSRGEQFWDGRMTHNPTIHKVNDQYVLFYIGSTYNGPDPMPDTIADDSRMTELYERIRIGLATSASAGGPWTRLDQPVLMPRPGKWDGNIVTNPAACIVPDGTIKLYYRSNTPEGLRLGLAEAKGLGEPFERVVDKPVIEFGEGCYVEDPYVWWQDDHFELIAKDLTGGICGELNAGIHALSKNGVDWNLAQTPKAYSRRITWDDGTETVQGCVERPQLLIQNGNPTHLFAATGDGPGGFGSCQNTWNMVYPLRMRG